MGKTNRHTPRDGEFKKLKASKKPRNKKQRAAKAKLQKQLQLQFASQHRANRNMTQLNAAMYMNKSTEADFDPSTFDFDTALNDETIPNQETIAAIEETELLEAEFRREGMDE